MTAALSAAPGFFGKVRTHGDFVSRRLPPGVVAVWDAWLQAGMAASREQLGARWLDAYLTSPVWRFALGPGVCDAGAWAGVLMPGVDRVGRHFPLTVAAPLPAGAALLDGVANGQPWYDAVEALALSSLDEGFRLDDFDASLVALPALPAPVQAAAAPPGRHGTAGYRLPLALLDALPAALPHLLGAALLHHSLWWTAGSDDVEPCALLCRGLPAPGAYASLLAGTWAAAGW